MTLALIIGGFMLLAFPGWLDPRHRFGPARFARIGRASMTLGFASVVLGFTLWGAPAMLHWADALGVPGLCDAAVHQLPFGGLELAIPMSAIAIMVVGRAFSAARHARLGARRARVDPFFGRHRQMGGYDVVVIPSAQLVAVGVPGVEPQIVLSEGLVAELSSIELDAVIRHEVAHHRLRHRRYLFTAAVIDQVLGWIPPVRSSATCLRNAVEEWADLESTGSSHAHIATLCSALHRLASRRTTADRQAIERRIASLDSNGRTEDAERQYSVGPWVPAVALGALGAIALVFTFQLTDAVIRCRV